MESLKPVIELVPGIAYTAMTSVGVNNMDTQKDYMNSFCFYEYSEKSVELSPDGQL